MKNLKNDGEIVVRSEDLKNNINTNESLGSDIEILLLSATPGKTITLNLFEEETGEQEICTYNLVDHKKTNEKDISLESPIGKNILNLHIGDSASYTVNNFKFTVLILNIQETLKSA